MASVQTELLVAAATAPSAADRADRADRAVSDVTHQEAFAVTASASFFRQLAVLTKKELVIKIREYAATLVSVLNPIFVLFILFILNISLSQTVALPSTAPFSSLSSKCPAGTTTTTCIALGYVTPPASAAPVVAALTDIVKAAEPNARIVAYASRDALIADRNANPTRFVAGVEFLNVSDLIAGTSVTPAISYNIFANSTVYLSGYNEARADAVSLYVQTAILNVFRARQSLPPLRSPLDTKTPSSLNGAFFANIRGKMNSAIQSLMPYYFLFMFQSILQGVLGRLATERTNKTKAGLIMMGTNDTAYLLSTLFGSMLFGLVTALIVVLIVNVGSILRYSSPVLVFLLMFPFVINLALMGGLLAVFFPNSRQTQGISNLSMIAGLALFGICQIFVWKLNNPVLNHIVMLVPQVAFGRAVDLMSAAETATTGLVFSSFTAQPQFKAPFYMLAVDIVLYWTLLWYCDKVFPGENGGTPQPFGFFLRPDFWSGSSAGTMDGIGGATKLPAGAPTRDASAATVASQGQSFEMDRFTEDFDLSHVAPHNQNLLRVVGVVKDFKVTDSTTRTSLLGRLFGRLRRRSRLSSPNGKRHGHVRHQTDQTSNLPATSTEQLNSNENDNAAEAPVKTIKRAVDHVSFDLHGDQILALLGHNGAGKTTTMSMITGIVQPTHGHVYLKCQSAHGTAVLDAANPISLPVYRQSLGVCPQFDVLFDTLTVREHLMMYIGIKGVVVHGKKDGSAAGTTDSGNSRNKDALTTEYIEAMARDVELFAKLDARVHTLSGGMKRKLSVAIALMGSPRVVLLDEPTTGMDVAAQQRIWSLMRACKKDRVVILTTHSMEEAEVLGDRIAIMAAGSVKTLGTSIFLKNQFGTGYSLRFEKRGAVGGGDADVNASNAPIMSFVRTFFANATLEAGSTDKHATVMLQHGSTAEGRLLFADFYRALQTAMAPGGSLSHAVQNVNLNLATLEDVFMQFRD
ncbi:hypothetical protein BC831DRAFT_510071 [Entophlyctis helioformis]|nr:hypothetical protein BC831DRAFT_510071 [Entophlyctis helioformis]